MKGHSFEAAAQTPGSGSTPRLVGSQQGTKFYAPPVRFNFCMQTTEGGIKPPLQRKSASTHPAAWLDSEMFQGGSITVVGLFGIGRLQTIFVDGGVGGGRGEPLNEALGGLWMVCG